MRFWPSWRRGPGDILAGSEVAFLICVEANRLEPQARLLCESIRWFGGRYREAPIVAVSPRPHLAPGRTAREQLEALGVACVTAPLNETGSPYGTINRIVSGAWAERSLDRPWLVLLDTDTVLVGEPELLRADFGARPVDTKGSASAGPGDPLDAYWARLCGFAGISLARLPFLRTTTDGTRIRASYNGGFAVVKRELGILQQTHDVFFAAFGEGLAPLAGSGLDVHASTGRVGTEASSWWGSSQAALAVAAWSRTRDVRHYDDRYNVPLHILVNPAVRWPTGPGREPVLVHYHFLAEPEHRSAFGPTLRRLGCPVAAAEWVEERLPLFGA